MKSLVLAEKPSVGREIARVLRCNSKNKGYCEGPDYVVTWSLGHLVTLAEPEDYDQKYRHWKIEDLPMIPDKMKLKVIRQTSHQFQVVRKLMQRGDIKELIIATDAGREGELVARWIMVLTQWKKPFKRLWISSQTDAAIRQGFAALKPGIAYNNLFDAAVCRAEADWLIGLNISRALSCKHNAQLNAGRVQTPTLAMIVQREKKIEQFVPVDYWTVRANFGDYFGDWRDQKGNNRLFDQAKAAAIIAKVNGQSGEITEVRTEGKREPPPLAYDLTELQRDANRRYGFSAQKTLAVLQELYERHKVVTYPRTDSRYITPDIVPTLPARLQAMGVGPYQPFARPLLQKPLAPTKRFVDATKVSDHHAIIPTEQPLQLAALTTDERNLYDLIARRFLAVFYPPYRFDQTTLTTVVNGEQFYSRGKVVKDLGWRVVAGTRVAKDEDDREELPEQSLTRGKKGEPKTVKNCKLKKQKTKPPARYTEATLLSAMESAGKFIADEELREAVKGCGLGTPATRAEIIEKLVNAYYIERHGKELVPTGKGRQLIKLVAPALKSPELTGQWEQVLTNIARGQANKRDFLKAIKQNTAELVKSVITDTAVYEPDNLTNTKCPLCGQYMLAVRGKRGKMLVCQNRGCGHRQGENDRDGFSFRSSKQAGRVNQQLIARYSDNQEIGQNLGDLLKAALAQKGQPSDKKNR